MLNNLSLNYRYQSPKSVNFRGYNNTEHGIKSANAQEECIQQTSFFRNLETLNFTKNYLVQQFPQGTHIAGFGCSNGEEEYSLAMLLKKHNQDKRFQITGVDLVPKSIELAQHGPFKISMDNSEFFIIADEYSAVSGEQRQLCDLFHENFEPVHQSVFQYSNPQSAAELISKRIETETDKQKLIQLKCFREIVSHPFDYEKENTYTPKRESFDGVVDFKTGDIHDISLILGEKPPTGVIIFKNAWYHILGSKNSFDPKRLNLKGVSNVMSQCNQCLPKGGLLVVGNLVNDHIYSGKKGHTIIQDGKEIKVYDETIFHDLLRKNGFEPIFYEAVKNRYGEIDTKVDIHLPSVWKKVKHIV